MKIYTYYQNINHFKQNELKHQSPTQNEDEDPFAVDWSNLDGRNVAKGNWD